MPSAAAVVFYALLCARIRQRWELLPASAPIILGLVMAFWPESLFRITITWYYQWQELFFALMVWRGFVWVDEPGVRNAVYLGLSAGILALINPPPATVLLAIATIPVISRAMFDSLGEARYMPWAKKTAQEYIRANPGRFIERTATRVWLYWITDVTDAFTWFGPESQLELSGRIYVFARILTFICAVVPLSIVLFALVTGVLRALPYKAAFLGIFLLPPLPTYLTTRGELKGMPIRSWLAVLAVIALLAYLQRRRGRRDAENG